MYRLRNKPIAVLDLETSGLIPGTHEVLEVGIVKDHHVSEDELGTADDWYQQTTSEYDLNGRKRCLNLKIKPSRIGSAQPKALEVNGYKEEDWKDAVTPEEAAHRINAFLKGCVICGYNVKFDMGFLEALFKEVGVKPSWSHHQVDVVAMAYEHLVPCGLEQLSLKAVCEFLGIEPEPEVHRAINGALRCQQVREKLSRASWFDRMRWWWRNRKRMEKVREEMDEKDLARRLRKATT